MGILDQLELVGAVVEDYFIPTLAGSFRWDPWGRKKRPLSALGCILGHHRKMGRLKKIDCDT